MTTWNLEKNDQLSAEVLYDQSNLTYNDINTEYGGPVITVWTLQTGQ